MADATRKRQITHVQALRCAILLALVVLVIVTAGRARGAGESPRPEAMYGLLTLTPALAAIGLAIVSRQVLPSLGLGIVVASFMLLPCLPEDRKHDAAHSLAAGLRVAVETYVVGAAADPDHIKIIVFTLTVGAMIGVVGANGGTAALVYAVARRATGKRAGQLVAWASGLVVFFDDYANSMIVGPTMRPIFDRLKISRAKLAYVVDSTAAPVASIALIGGWIGAEIGYIQDGFDKLGDGSLPECLVGVTAYQSFLYSLPYRFYSIFALLLVVLIALSGRDFGPMVAAERRAASAEPVEAAREPVSARRWWLAGVPVFVLITTTISIIIATGLQAIAPDQPVTLPDLLAGADPYASILYAALAAASAAILMSLFARALTLAEAIDSGMHGAARMLPAVVILVLAWALSASTQDLHLGDVVTARLQGADFSLSWLPLMIFLSAAGVSLATGTSWGTMGILCPVAVEVSARLVADVPPDVGLRLFYASVGAVLAGAIFGDHCSPISDTTVLSAAASGCSLEDHVWTQAPYAAVAALAAILAGNVLCGLLGAPVWIGLVVGSVGLGIAVRAMGRRL
ncbi:MAG: hypothetical protein JSV19_08065 [Phycisphaerales bacterium]|nr:MAG: hypothetical protein JSV19_08065 [Phycisphaerales bacterium]